MNKIEKLNYSIEGVEEWIKDYENELVMIRLTGEERKFQYKNFEKRIAESKIILNNLRIKLKRAKEE